MLLDYLDENPTGAGSLARWHLEQAEKAELEAIVAAQARRRLRLLSAAEYHRDCARMAQEEEL